MRKFSNFLLLESGDHLAFFKGMMGDPAATALVFADWLDEHGRAPHLAAAIRMILQGQVNTNEEREKIIKAFEEESLRLNNLKYSIVYNRVGETFHVTPPTRYEPKLAKFLQVKNDRNISIYFDGHGLYGFNKNSRWVSVNTDLITRPDTIEALIFEYLHKLVIEHIKIIHTTSQGLKYNHNSRFKNVNYDTNKEMASIGIEKAIGRITGLINSTNEKEKLELEKQLKGLEKLNPASDLKFNTQNLLDEVISTHNDPNNKLRKRIENIVVKFSGRNQLTGLIGRAAHFDLHQFCPIISQISSKLKFTGLAAIFNHNPIENNLFVVNIYEVTGNWEGEGGDQEYITEEPDHIANDEQCNLEQLLHHMEEFEYEDGSSWLSSRRENYQTGAETERTIHVGLTEEVGEINYRDIDENSLEILYKASQWR